jgi:Zn-dependent protease
MSGVRVARISGVDIVADGSLVLLAGLLTWAMYIDLDRSFPDAASSALVLLAFVGGLAFIGSVLAHELSHSVLAQRRGLEVRRIRLFVFGGVSEIEVEPRDPGEELSVSVAGPAASAAIGLLLLAVAATMSPSPGQRTLWILALANLALAAFNLLPGLPLDGGRVLHAVLWRIWDDRPRATHWATVAGQGLGLLVAVAGAAILFIRVDLGGLWMVAIGWFVYRAATANRAREQLVGRLSGLTVADVMRPVDAAVSGDLTIQELLDMYGFGARVRDFPVEVDGRVRGVIGNRELGVVEPTMYRYTLVATTMTEIGQADVVSAGASLESLMTRPAGDSGRAVAVESGRVVGLVTPTELAGVLD